MRLSHRLGRLATPARSALALALVLAVQPLGAAPGSPSVALPSMGDVSSQSLSPVAERKLGDRIMRSIRRDPDVVDDPLVQEHVQRIWDSLLASARRRGEITDDLDAVYAWRPFLVKDRSVNAFALPGGYIGIHFGLLAVTSTPEEFASVLAHELSHVTQRHIARLMGQSKESSWVSIASMVLGAIALSRSPQAGQALILGGQGLAQQGQLNFSRDMEREADRVGQGVLDEAGFDPTGMARMFELLARASRLNDDNSFPYLRTHPLTTERIGEAQARLGSDSLQGVRRGANASPTAQALATAQLMVSARSRVLMDPRSASLAPMLAQAELPDARLPAGVSPLVAHYTGLVAAVTLKDAARVDALSRKVREDVAALPEAQAQAARRLWQLTWAEGLVDTGRAAQGLAMLQPSLMAGRPLEAGSASALQALARPEVMLRARAALNLPEARDPRDVQAALSEAASRLQALQSDAQGQDLAAWQMLSALFTRMNQPLRAVRAEAEAAALMGDLQGALDRVQAVRKRYPAPSAADLIELQVLEARARVWMQNVKDDLREAQG